MISETVVTETGCEHHHHHPRLSWSAIFAGAFVGVGLGFLLHLFGIAIGLSAYSSTPDGATAIAIGGLVGILIGVIASMGVAGFVAGYLGRFHYCHCHGGVIYGFVTWSIALFLSAIFIIPLTHYISIYTRELAPTVVVTKSVVQEADDSTENDVSSPAVKKQVATKQPTTQDALVWSAWIVFILFFIGALCSCIGACCGMSCKRHELHHSAIPSPDQPDTH